MLVTITEIEVHEIHDIGFTEWMAPPLRRMYGSTGLTQRVIYVVHANVDGLDGIGEGHGEAEEVVQSYIGTSPFDHVNDMTSLGLGTAMYDLMGKATGKPCWKLFGPMARRWVPVSSWYISTTPSVMAEVVQRYSEMGHTWMKFHLSPLEDVIAQVEAIQAVAAEGFRLHFDFTMYGDQGGDHIASLLEKLSEYPVAGCFEDALWQNDFQGYEELRRRANRPVGLHHFPLGATTEMMQHRMGDFYMLGHQYIGTSVKKAGVFEAAKVPFMMQNTGGMISRAMAIHMSGVFPTATFPTGNASEVFAGDVVKPSGFNEVVNGLVQVSDAPGLGLELDRSALERLNANVPDPRHDALFLIKSTYRNGTIMWNAHESAAVSSGWLCYGPFATKIGFAEAKTTEYLEDDGSAEWAGVAAEIRQQGGAQKGMVLVKTPSPKL
eukprot:SAG22_NODE_1645_length_3901_cov_2.101262_4_plen_436_part_00